MNTQANLASRPSKEQVIYANILVIGVWIGLGILFLTYAIYVSGILPSHVDMMLVTQNWDKGVNEYLAITHSPHGLGWLALMGKGDFLNYLGFAFLALLTIVCYLVLVKGYFAKKDWIYAGIAILEILVLSLAASGLLGGGGH
ncbi:MAG: DUF1634 domain-containing protein [Proteobacteria bacterium]|nr:DUF1634 domain-containing protein [Desulfobacula sp.]MBU3954187.1 DUF1634 domain-containing protein [Pseudomonadota bacterium]MBU4129573.1 DUF1634 domain-containing protein [Pseudomonadota bacterium]